MAHHLIWLIAGFVLVISELASGTFHLLVLGIAAFAGALAAWLGFDIWIQATVAAVLAVAGVMLVRSRTRGVQGPDMASLDVGQPVKFDTWTDQRAGLARVRYRDTQWDARIDGDAGAPVAGDAFRIVAVEGSLLRVTRP